VIVSLACYESGMHTAVVEGYRAKQGEHPVERGGSTAGAHKNGQEGGVEMR